MKRLWHFAQRGAPGIMARHDFAPWPSDSVFWRSNASQLERNLNDTPGAYFMLNWRRPRPRRSAGRNWRSSEWLQNDTPTRPQLTSLEARIVPTTNLILDFDGGTLQNGQGYAFPPGFGTNFTAFTAFPATSPAGAGNRTEQILQILAGVRQDFADFDVRVVWDDRGVNSPIFTGRDTVVMIVAEDGGAFGVAPSVDTGNTSRDCCLAFLPPHLNVNPPIARRQIRELIDTISHEAGHSFGLSHSSESDAQMRQITTIAPQNVNLDSRFSTQSLNHASPEAGVSYAEVTRLTANLGAALPGTTLTNNETQTNQTLPQDTSLTTVATATTVLTVPGSIDHAGDRDAFRLTFTEAGTYTIQQNATGSAVAPVLTLWDADGDFIAVGSTGTAGGKSTLTFVATAGQTIYAVAGTAFDRLDSGVTGTATIGAYSLEINPPGGGGGQMGGEILVGADAGGLPLVRLYDVSTGAVIWAATVFDQRFTGGVRVARGDVNGDGTDDMIVAAGPNGGPHVKVFDGVSFKLIASFFAYDRSFSGGVFVASGDINGDGFDDIITGAGAGGGPHVRVFSSADGSLLFDSFVYAPTFSGGVSVASGDIDGDGFEDIITGAGRGGGPHVEAFSGADGQLLRSFYAFPGASRAGVYVAAGDINGDGLDDIIAGAGSGTSPNVRAYDSATGALLMNFNFATNGVGSTLLVSDSGYDFGARVAATDLNGDGLLDVVVGTGPGRPAEIRMFDAAGTGLLGAFLPLEYRFLGGVFVG